MRGWLWVAMRGLTLLYLPGIVLLMIDQWPILLPGLWLLWLLWAGGAHWKAQRRRRKLLTRLHRAMRWGAEFRQRPGKSSSWVGALL